MKKIFFLTLIFGVNVLFALKEEYVRPFYPPYFSQCGQDKFVNEHIFKNKKNGVFVDIGAHDGVSLSNTCFFEKELGWTGICIEPFYELFKELVGNRSKKTTCLPFAVANFDGESDFLKVEGPPEMLSGLVDYYDPRHLDRVDREVKERGGKKVVVKTQVRKLSTIFKKYELQKIDFMSIDTEGSELEVLKSIDFDSVKIHVITVENNYKDNKIYNFLVEKGFLCKANLMGDDIYVYSKWHEEQ